MPQPGLADPLGTGGGPGTGDRGPALSAEARPLTVARFARWRASLPWVADIRVLDVIGSTNEELRRLAAGGAPTGTVVIAESQSRGRGRHGRAWHSPPGLGLYLSALFRPGGTPVQATCWTVAGAVAACEAARTLASPEIRLEWPNDLFWRRRKLAGVLAESRSQGRGLVDLVLGVGWNVGQAPGDFPPALSSSATSLRQAGGGAAPDRTELAVVYLRRLGELAAELERGAWAGIAGRFEALAPGCRGRRVWVRRGGSRTGQVVGVTCGIDALGGLLVRQEDGSTTTVRFGDSVVFPEDD